jgi:CRISPR-associated protein Csd1
MIVQALQEFYLRKTDLPREGWEEKEIPFIIVLDIEGNPVDIENTFEGAGKQKRAKAFLVPMAIKRTVGVAPNAFWDNLEYVLGQPQKGKPERVAAQHIAFLDCITSLELAGNMRVQSLLRFLRREDKITILQNRFPDRWQEMLETPGANLSFRLAADSHLILNDQEIVDAINRKHSGTDAPLGVCLVTGRQGEPLAELHPPIKGVWGAQSTGGNIVSFNLDSFGSFGKKQGLNAPIGRSAAFRYTTALNYLLGKDSKLRIQVGDASTVFWADRETVLEEQMNCCFSEPPKDDPERNVEAIRALHEAVSKGGYAVSDATTRFFVLGLAPNAARISVRFWWVGTVPEMAARIDRHFQDLSLVHAPKERPGLSLFRLLASTAVQGKSENIAPVLGGDVMRAILDGTPYPLTLLQAVIRRIRAEHEVNNPRAALVKACLNRSLRVHNPTMEKELTMSLDPTNKNIGYRLGRLFALLEKIQGEAQGSTNSTIRDRFYGAASGTPVTVFGNLMRLKNHHLAKLGDGLRIVRERQLQEIVSEIPASGFPAHLMMADQGRFAVGYYHQMQALFTKKSETETTAVTKEMVPNE